MGRSKKIIKLLVVLIIISVFVSCFGEVNAKQITGTVNDNYRKFLEQKYGFCIIIDENVKQIKQKESFYTIPVAAEDIELKILKDIESAFAMLPEGFVKEVIDYFKSRNYEPSINIKYGKFIDGVGNEEAPGKFYSKDISIHMARNGNSFILNLLHEFGHVVQYYLTLNNKSAEIENYFKEQTNKSKYKYNDNFGRLNNINLGSDYYDYFLSIYSSRNYMEDFTETFSYAITQYIYISSYGNGVIKPIHNKINKISQVLCGEFKSLKNSKFLLNCMPDIPSKWAETAVKTAKEKEIILWNIYGLNHSEITKYDMALILKPFLYKYIDENNLLKKANLKNKIIIPEDFVYDILNADDIFLLHNLEILKVENKYFNPTKKIQRQEFAEIITKIAQLFDLKDTKKTEIKCDDVNKIANWAKPFVNFAVSMHIMDVDDKNNFNPERYITYQEVYNILLNLYNIKEAYNSQNKIKLPDNNYQDLSATAISTSGWIYNYGIYVDDNYYIYSALAPNIGGFTGKGKIIQKDGGYFEGEWKDGEFIKGTRKFVWFDYWQEGEWKERGWNGKGRQVWIDGSWFEGDWKDGYFINGACKQIFNDGSWFEGEYKNGYPWNGKGVSYKNNKKYDFKYINGEIQR